MTGEQHVGHAVPPRRCITLKAWHARYLAGVDNILFSVPEILDLRNASETLTLPSTRL